MADVELSYKGNIIGSLSASGTLTMETAGMYCEDDIELTYTSPGGGGGSGPYQIVLSQDEDGYLILDDTATILTAVGVSF